MKTAISFISKLMRKSGYLLLAVSCLAPAVYAAEYRISTQADFDQYKAAGFQPGDKILFERGKVFEWMSKDIRTV